MPAQFSLHPALPWWAPAQRKAKLRHCPSPPLRRHSFARAQLRAPADGPVLWCRIIRWALLPARVPKAALLRLLAMELLAPISFWNLEFAALKTTEWPRKSAAKPVPGTNAGETAS